MKNILIVLVLSCLLTGVGAYAKLEGGAIHPALMVMGITLWVVTIVLIFMRLKAKGAI